MPWLDPKQSADQFHHLHELRYGHRLDLEVELVTARAKVSGAEAAIQLPVPVQGRQVDALIDRVALVTDRDIDAVPVYDRSLMGSACEISGPALITEMVSTTYVQPGWICTVDAVGNLLLRKNSMQ